MVVETVKLIDTIKKLYPVAQFFKDRYFPDEKCFYSEKALIEMQRGSRKVAPFVVPIANGIAMEKDGYTSEYIKAPYIAPKISITPEDLEKKAFGEDPRSGKSPASREKELEAEYIDTLRNMILRRHELMCAQIITTGEVIMRHYATAQDVINGKNYKELVLRYFGKGGFQNKYKFSKKFAEMTAQEKITELYKMARILKKKGVAVSDIVMTGDVSMLLMTDPDFLEFYNKRAVEMGTIKQSELPDGVSYNGTININGIVFNMFTYDNEYEDDNKEIKQMFPEGTIAMLQPNMGKTVYGQVTFVQGQGFKSYAQKIVPRLVASEDENVLTLYEFSRPVPYPTDPEGWLVANINDEVSGMSLNDGSIPVALSSEEQNVDLKTEDEINAMKKDDLYAYGESIGAPVTSAMKLEELKTAIIEYQATLE